ncbi:GntR family transcriptional regulator [Streptomyces sp. NPDC019396]|uniref:GntR family transcriptional regulator n=1 Tax=Streptomyces sp. NPDC019396 TaxID=3154687 RepID=UPI0033FE9EDD
MAYRHQFIADELRAQISTGRIKAGDRLPSEAQLASRYTVSVPTLRNALAVLQGEGLIEKVHGLGNFVRQPFQWITYVGGSRRADAHAAAEAGLRVSVRTVRLKARGILVDLMQVPAGATLVEYRYLSLEGESPHSLSRVYVPSDSARDDDHEGAEPIGGDGLVARLAAPHPPLAEVRERISARLPTNEEAMALRISTALAVLSIERVAVDADGRVVEGALLVLPGDRADAVFTTHHTMNEGRGTEG